MADEDCVIVGAGPAGSAAALLLARAGQPPLLLERSGGRAGLRPRPCGEFVSGEAVTALAALGVDVAALGGEPTRRLRLACGSQLIEAELPFTGYGLSRAVLDEALRARAQAAGARLWRGVRASVQQAVPQRLQLRVAGEAPTHTLQPRTLLLACGKSDLAPWQRRPRREPEPLLGLQLHLRLQPTQWRALQGHVEVMLFADAPGYGGLQPVDGGRANLCLLLPRDAWAAGLPRLLQALGRDCTLLAQRLQDAAFDDAPPCCIFRVPYGYLHRATAADPPQLWRLGDQAAVVPSFTGDGMAIALHSAAVAAEELLAGADAAHYHRRLARELRAQMARATALYRIGRSPLTRRVLLGLMRRWPALPGWLAAMTRVNAAALRL